MRQPSSTSALRSHRASARAGQALTPHTLLAGHPFFATLTAEDVSRLLAFTHCRTVASGRAIFCKGDAGDGLYGVLGGQVAFTISSANGRELVLNLLGPGEFFGEIALLDGQGRSATALARGACRLLYVPRREFLAFFADRPAALMQIITLLCARLRRSTDYIADSAFLGLSPRLGKLLIGLLTEANQDAQARLRVSQAQLAAMLGVARERVNRQLVVWASQGILEQYRGGLLIRDRLALERVVRDGT